MSLNRPNIRGAWRVAAAWLVVLSMIVGPMGLSGAWAKTCGLSCPCDDAHASTEAASHAASQQDAQHDAHEDAKTDNGGPIDDDCPEDCPDDCPDCACCLGVALGVVPMTITSVKPPYDALAVEPSPETPHLGAPFKLYRPPRPLI